MKTVEEEQEEKNTLKHLKAYILTFDMDEVHHACNNAGHDSGWEYFEDELKTYLLCDCLTLLDALEDLNVLGYD